MTTHECASLGRKIDRLTRGLGWVAAQREIDDAHERLAWVAELLREDAFSGDGFDPYRDPYRDRLNTLSSVLAELRDRTGATL